MERFSRFEFCTFEDQYVIRKYKESRQSGNFLVDIGKEAELHEDNCKLLTILLLENLGIRCEN